jgi:hypothetical protein
MVIKIYPKTGQNMQLDKLFGSKTKVDILKYLLFRRQGVSMRALESELSRTFPAIKKQIDSLRTANVIETGDDKSKWSIIIKPDCIAPIKSIFMYGIRNDISLLFKEYEVMIDSYYLGKIFGNNLDYDLVVTYKNCERPQMEVVKESISAIFRDYYIENISVVIMSKDERDKRYRLADKFVLSIMKQNVQPIMV